MTVKHEIERQEDRFLEALLAPVISSLVKGISGGRVRRAGRGYINKLF